MLLLLFTMEFLLYFLFFISVSLTQEDFLDDNLLQLDNDDSQNSITSHLDLDPNNADLVAWNFDSGEKPLDQQSTDVDLDLWHPQTSEDGLNTDLLLVGADDACSSTDKVEKRDRCSINDITAPKLQLPTLDDLMNRIVPTGSSDDQQTSSPELFLTGGLLAKDKTKCSPDKPYYLCCDCVPLFLFYVCQDCLAGMCSSLIWSSFPFASSFL